MACAILRIVDWDENFENSRTRTMKTMTWVPLPNKHDGEGYTELLDHPDGALHYACWVAITQVASKCRPRGTLIRGTGEGHDNACLARMTKIPESAFDAAIPRLVKMKWLEPISLSDIDLQPTVQEGDRSPSGDCQEPSTTRARENGTERNGRERNGREGKSTSGRSLDRSEIEKIDWKRVAVLVEQLFHRIQKKWKGWRAGPAVLDKLAKATACVVLGVLPDEWILNVVDEMIDDPKPKNHPHRWLGKVLASTAKEKYGVDFDAYQRAIKVPKGGEK